MTAASLEAEKELYLDRVGKLLGQCERWALEEEGAGASVLREETTLKERRFGDGGDEDEDLAPYQAPVLAVRRPGRGVVRLVPRGRWIIGADGRVDLAGQGGEETLLYYPPGSRPSLSFRAVTDAGHVFEDVPEPDIPPAARGWHFLQGRKLKLYPALDRELFFRLLEALG